MKNVKILTLISAFILFFSNSSYSQLFKFMMQSEKVAIFPEASVGVLLTTAYGKGSETSLGGGIEFSPFKRFFYFKFAAKHLVQSTHDNSPNVDIFTDLPQEVKLRSVFLRMEYGIKIRLDWWFKSIDYEGIHLLIGTYYMNDLFIEEQSDLLYESNTVSSSSHYSDYSYNGQMYELGLSWVFNKSLKWDSSLYVYYLDQQNSLIQNGFLYTPNSKTAIGISSSVFLLF